MGALVSSMFVSHCHWSLSWSLPSLILLHLVYTLGIGYVGVIIPTCLHVVHLPGSSSCSGALSMQCGLGQCWINLKPSRAKRLSAFSYFSLSEFFSFFPSNIFPPWCRGNICSELTISRSLGHLENWREENNDLTTWYRADPGFVLSEVI